MREKWLSVNWRELILKTLMMLSYVSWIYLAMPASENGKFVGCGLLIIIFFFVIKMSISECLDDIVNRGKKTVFFISIIIALYYIGTYYWSIILAEYTKRSALTLLSCMDYRLSHLPTGLLFPI